MWLFKKKIDKDVEQNLINFIEQNCIPYGSRIWGGFTKNSDYDYLIDTSILLKLLSLLKLYNINYKEHNIYRPKLYNDDLYTVEINNKKYQFIHYFNNKDYYKFSQAINLMTKYSSIYNMSNKKLRHKTFGQFFYIVHNKTKVLDDQISNFINEYFPEYGI
ncbi:MAG: hypothetical protein PVF17_05925 [Ignavibacteria bacterium]|jgi:hypothetical protein